jgi:hypothetical protein
MIAAIAGLALVAWTVVARRRAVERRPSEHAFRGLARRMRVSARHEAIIRRLASCAQCAPVALLVSEHALRAAASCFEKTGPSKRDTALVRELLA